MKTTMIGSGILAALAVATMGIAGCSRADKAGETSTTSATTSTPAGEVAPAPGGPSNGPTAIDNARDDGKDAGHIAPLSDTARSDAKDGGAHVQMGAASTGNDGMAHGQSAAPQQTARTTGTVDNSVGPGHITTPALPDDHRATGAPNSAGSHNMGTAH